MKKILLMLILLLALFGCDKQDNSEQAKYDAYVSYYDTILETKTKLESSDYYDFQLAINKLSDNEYRYDLIIDNPRVAMYDIKALAIIDGIYSDKNKTEMMPSFGIFDDEKISMIPGQIDNEKGLYKGITLSLISNKPGLKISAMIIWSDANGNNTTREYISVYGEYSE